MPKKTKTLTPQELLKAQKRTLGQNLADIVTAALDYNARGTHLLTWRDQKLQAEYVAGPPIRIIITPVVVCETHTAPI